MSSDTESPMDRLWREYSRLFHEFDDLTLARWMAQTLGQIEGRAWRLSHPLLGAYRLAAQVGHDRQIWFKRLVSVPSSYAVAECCRAPLPPLFTRDVVESGLVCQHCSETLMPFSEFPEDTRKEIQEWGEIYAKHHAVAHWNDREQAQCDNYTQACEQAAQSAEGLLVRAALDIVPRFLDTFQAIVWEDQDECLEVRPEDLDLLPRD